MDGLTNCGVININITKSDVTHEFPQKLALLRSYTTKVSSSATSVSLCILHECTIRVLESVTFKGPLRGDIAVTPGH